MQDEGPFHDEPPPTEEELAAARALAAALDGETEPAPGSLAELARAARASASSASATREPPLSRAVVSRAIDEGLSRRRRTRTRAALAAFAAAALAVAGFVGLSPMADHATPQPVQALTLPALSVPRERPLTDTERTSDRADRLARLASADWLAAELAVARAEGESP
jgi:hypothetical protein